MSEGMTGTTPEQIEAAAERYQSSLASVGCQREWYDQDDAVAMVESFAEFIVPPDHRIVPAASVPSDAVVADLEVILDSVEEARPYLIQYERTGYPTAHLERVRAWLAARAGTPT